MVTLLVLLVVMTTHAQVGDGSARPVDTIVDELSSALKDLESNLAETASAAVKADSLKPEPTLSGKPLVASGAKAKDHAAPEDLQAKKLSMKVEVPVRSKRRKEGEEEPKKQYYFATFDSTAISTAWMTTNTLSREREDKIIAEERKKRGQPVNVQSTSAASPAAADGGDSKIAAAAKEAAAMIAETLQQQQQQLPPVTLASTPASAMALDAASAAALSAPPPATLSDEDKTRMRAEAQALYRNSVVLKEMHPQNAMEFVQRQLPLVLLVLCDCELDLQIMRAWPYVERLIRKRHWDTQFTFVYILPPSRMAFEINRVYLLDGPLIDVGGCPENKCVNNEKEVLFRFPTPLADASQLDHLRVSNGAPVEGGVD